MSLKQPMRYHRSLWRIAAARVIETQP
jgi:hypothetical protein